MIPSSMLQKAGNYLLSVLKSKSSVRYSEFYNAKDETRDRLIGGMGITEDEADWYSAEALMDDAVVLFEHVGVVEKKILAERLIDGEQDYEIILTEDGRQFIDQGADYEFPDLEMHL